MALETTLNLQLAVLKVFYKTQIVQDKKANENLELSFQDISFIRKKNLFTKRSCLVTFIG